jgi:hypothetical protein
MAVTKLDISPAARAAGHLYLTTTLAAFFPLASLISVPWTLATHPIVAGVIASVFFLFLGIGVLSALYYARRELNGWAYVIATLCAVQIGAVLCYGLAVALAERKELIYLFVVFAIYIMHVLIDYARLALGRHNALSIPQLRLANDVSKLLRQTRSLVPRVHVPTNPVRTFVYAILFVLSYLQLSIIQYHIALRLPNMPSEIAEPIPFFSFLFELISFAFLAAMVALTRRHYVLRADRVLELDNRRPILFLRSFADDKVRLWGKGIYGKLRRRTIDEAIKRFAERLGPFIAIANPNTKLPRLGAAQTYFSNETWQNAIARWVQMAQMIVMVAGRTEGLRWELDHIFSNEGQAKLVIFLPPALRKDSVVAARWFTEHFSHSRYGQDLSAIDPRRVIGIAFREDGLFVVETQRIRRREVDYLVALQAIIFATQVNAPGLGNQRCVEERRRGDGQK